MDAPISNQNTTIQSHIKGVKSWRRGRLISQAPGIRGMNLSAGEQLKFFPRTACPARMG